MKVLDFAPPPTSLPDLSQAEGRKLSRLSVEQATGSLPGASVLQAVKDSQREGMAILPALRAGDYKGAGLAFIRSTTAALGAIPEVHALPAFAGIISAYHGSPHVFDEFKLEKVGTGEGAQAYGHGLYFAEREGVAKSYRTAGVKDAGLPMLDGEPVSVGHPMFDEINLIANGSNFDPIASAARSRQLAAEGGPFAKTFAAQADRMEKAAELAPRISRQEGNFYHVDLDVKPEELLDWDKPLSQQAPGVAEKLRGLGVPQAEHVTGQSAYYHLAGDEVMAGRARPGPTAEAAASGKLHAAGIPGIKYLDQGSRAAGDGTSNFVIFDPSLIAMVARNGQPLVSSADKARDGLAVLAHPDAWQPGGAK